MEKNNVELFLNLYSEFENQCKKIATKLNKVNSDYGGIDYFYIDTESKSVVGKGECHYGCGRIDYYYVDFDVNLLSYTDEELDSYVNNLLEEKRKEMEAEKKKQAKKEIDYIDTQIADLIRKKGELLDKLH